MEVILKLIRCQEVIDDICLCNLSVNLGSIQFHSLVYIIPLALFGKLEHYNTAVQDNRLGILLPFDCEGLDKEILAVHSRAEIKVTLLHPYLAEIVDSTVVDAERFCIIYRDAGL